MPLDQVDVDKLGKGKEMTFFEHLEELRWHIIRAVVAIVVIGIAVFLGGEPFFNNVVLGPKHQDFITYRLLCEYFPSICITPPKFDLIAREMGEQFTVHLKACIMLGLVLGFPYVFWEIWRFVKPGLYEKERNAVRGIVLICSALFLVGVLFGYFILAPFSITFLMSYTLGAINAPTLDSFVSYMVMFTLPTGLIFNMPVAAYFLAKIGLLHPSFLKKYRRHAIVVILIVAAIVTPPDVTSQLLITAPLLLLYEVSIVVASKVNKKREAELNA